MSILSRRAAATSALLAFSLTATGALAIGTSGHQAARSTVTVATAPRLIAIRAAHHPGYDRIVFEFAGGLPSRRNVRYVGRLIADPSGRGIPIAGRAILEASFSPATATASAGHSTAPSRIAFALPNVMTAVRAGDFESVLSYGIGLAKRTSVHVFTLTGPSRVVIDIATPFRTVLRRVYFENLKRFSAGTPPYVKAVLRPVLPSSPATGVMDRLFAGPTAGEYATGLRFQSSRATGFTGPSITALVAKLKLTGGCSSGGSTFSIAQEIMPTLKQFASVRYIKIYGPAGHTENPSGRSDSIPFCLEP